MGLGLCSGFQKFPKNPAKLDYRFTHHLSDTCLACGKQRLPREPSFLIVHAAAAVRTYAQYDPQVSGVRRYSRRRAQNSYEGYECIKAFNRHWSWLPWHPHRTSDSHTDY